MAKAFLLYADTDYVGPFGNKVNACIVVAADAAAAVVLAKALNDVDLAILWDNATAVDLSAALTTGQVQINMVGTPVAFS